MRQGVREAIHLTCFPKTAFSTKRWGWICLVFMCVCNGNVCARLYIYTPIPLTAFISSWCSSGWPMRCLVTPSPHPLPWPLHNPTSFSLHTLNPFAGVFLVVWHHANEGFLSAVGWQLLGCLSTDNHWKTASLFIFTCSPTCINNGRCYWPLTTAVKEQRKVCIFEVRLYCCTASLQAVCLIVQ